MPSEYYPSRLAIERAIRQYVAHGAGNIAVIPGNSKNPSPKCLYATVLFLGDSVRGRSPGELRYYRKPQETHLLNTLVSTPRILGEPISPARANLKSLLDWPTGGNPEVRFSIPGIDSSGNPTRYDVRMERHEFQGVMPLYPATMEGLAEALEFNARATPIYGANLGPEYWQNFTIRWQADASRFVVDYGRADFPGAGVFGPPVDTNFMDISGVLGLDSAGEFLTPSPMQDVSLYETDANPLHYVTGDTIVIGDERMTILGRGDDGVFLAERSDFMDHVIDDDASIETEGITLFNIESHMTTFSVQFFREGAYDAAERFSLFARSRNAGLDASRYGRFFDGDRLHEFNYPGGWPKFVVDDVSEIAQLDDIAVDIIDYEQRAGLEITVVYGVISTEEVGRVRAVDIYYNYDDGARTRANLDNLGGSILVDSRNSN